MDGWRRQRNDNKNQEVARTRSQNRKPPPGNWQPTVPSWEKKFCSVVGSVPWQTLLENKKFIHLFDNVLEWNDSAGKEAFINAKNRFWAQINGLSCHISSPDPDIYIDKIDWDSNIDPKLILELECESVAATNQEKGEQVVIIGELFVSKDLYTLNGWGDAEDDIKKASLVSENNGDSKDLHTLNGWGDAEDDIKKTSLVSENNGDLSEDNRAQAKESVRENEWGDACNDSWCGNQGTMVAKKGGWEDGWNQWENSNYESDNLQYGTNYRVWKPRNAHHRNQENTGGYVSRHKTSRFHGDDNPTNRKWRNGNERKRANFVCEQPYKDNGQWNSANTRAPIKHRGSAKQGNQLSW